MAAHIEFLRELFTAADVNDTGWLNDSDLTLLVGMQANCCCHLVPLSLCASQWTKLGGEVKAPTSPRRAGRSPTRGGGLRGSSPTRGSLSSPTRGGLRGSSPTRGRPGKEADPISGEVHRVVGGWGVVISCSSQYRWCCVTTDVVSVNLDFCQISEILRRYDKAAKGGITFEEFAHMCGHR